MKEHVGGGESPLPSDILFDGRVKVRPPDIVPCQRFHSYNAWMTKCRATWLLDYSGLSSRVFPSYHHSTLNASEEENNPDYTRCTFRAGVLGQGTCSHVKLGAPSRAKAGRHLSQFPVPEPAGHG